MQNLLSFGKHAGKSFEWLFFKAPWYAEWIYDIGIHRQRHNFTEDQEQYFLELFNRASCLKGTSCRYCRKHPFTRMGLSFMHRSGDLGHIGFFCNECEYTGGSATGYYTPSFFTEEFTLPRCEQLRITMAIRDWYIGAYERLTQSKMEAFFHNDDNFVYATPGFFTKQMTTA